MRVSPERQGWHRIAQRAKRRSGCHHDPAEKKKERPPPETEIVAEQGGDSHDSLLPKDGFTKWEEVGKEVAVSSFLLPAQFGSAVKMHFGARCTRFLERLLGRLKRRGGRSGADGTLPRTTASSPPLRGRDRAPPFPLLVQFLGWKHRLQL